MSQHDSEGDQIEQAIAEYFQMKHSGTSFTVSEPFKFTIETTRREKTLCIAEDKMHRGGVTMWYAEDQILPDPETATLREISDAISRLQNLVLNSSAGSARDDAVKDRDRLNRAITVKMGSHKAMEYLGGILHYLQDLHPDDQCKAYDDALFFYNFHNPNSRVEPTGLGYTSLVQPSLLGDDSESR
ncbi:hypothetical protein EVB94_020 [Rhizobium phage RHph_TM40]|uniref:Uncharacterized protein n=1 Tax=Rhizobium phage RHph_TM30 TaxID=2509764 RepID=A0A7S5R4T4_9CAUD|nr:hypothetical protein PQC16_gp020 [Rhizobium phage RHph_TM30]QIG71127.1 hypothetical protein EVB93_020 [Rhizobium phage RHph_TM30]QIG71491.1 hypothetical protein EVB94_020 [Rhizobium phage RHph_TM40]QIG71854.1 hypothetical protein EVB95_020 [Rhizobium phage RHph_TM2_3B]